MFITPLSNNIVQSKSSFKAANPNPEILKNQFKIMLTQDIWAEKLNVKKPESNLEKEVLLEILKFRKQLDRFVRLSNEKARITFDINYYLDLLDKNPNHPDLENLLAEIKKKGNITSVISTLKKNIELELKKHKPAMDYFKNIEKLEEEYINSKKIKPNTIAKFFAQVNKNNINAEHKYSTQDLIDIISNDTKLKEIAETQAVPKLNRPMSRKQFIAFLQREYERYLRENVNIYMGENHGKEALEGRKNVLDTNARFIKRYPGVTKQVAKNFDETQRVYIFKTNSLGEADIYPIGVIWKEMDKGLGEIKTKIKEIDELKLAQQANKENFSLKAKIDVAEEELADIKKEWSDNLQFSILCEGKNREEFVKKGTVEAYDYLTGANKEILRYKELDKICKENDGILPENIWEEILSK